METVDCTKIAEFVRANNGEADQDLVDFFLLTYVDCKDDPFPVSGDMAQKWIGFTRKDNFKRFVMNVRLAEGVDFVISLPREGNYKEGAGRPSEDMRFTVEAFKMLCMLAKTDMGYKVRVYYVKMEKVVGCLLERHRLHYQKMLLLESADSKRKAVHHALLKAYSRDVGLVYIAYVLDCDDGHMIIKIGSSMGLKERMKNLRALFGTIYMMEIIPSARFKEFENKLHNHTELEPFKIGHVMNDGGTSTETYKVNQSQYDMIVSLAKKVVKTMVHSNRESRRMYRERLAELNVQQKLIVAEAGLRHAEARLMQEKSLAETRMREVDNRARMVELIPQTFGQLLAMAAADPRDKDLKELANVVIGQLSQVFSCSPVQSSNEAVGSSYDQLTENEWVSPPQQDRVVTRGFAIQRYDEQGKTLIESYQSLSDAQRSFGGSVSGIRQAAKKRQVYKGHRWNEVDRDQDKDVPYDIGESVFVNTTDASLVAKLNIRGEDIVLDVFTSQAAAAEAEQLKNAQSIGLAMKKGSVSGGFRWKWWHQLDADVQQAYTDHHELPEIPRKQGTRIQRIHPTTGLIEETLDSIAAAMSKYRISARALKNACKGGHVHDGWCWAMVN